MSMPATWSWLLPPGVVVVDRPVRDEVAALLPEEAAEIAKAVAKRRFEFATGRACARQALAQLGVAPLALVSGPDRAPLWPAGVVGSISHTDRWCAAAVARARDVAALGIDLEPDEPLAPELWKQVATERERRWLDGCGAASRAAPRACSSARRRRSTSASSRRRASSSPSRRSKWSWRARTTWSRASSS
jgi:4'-phosphopantetheinyl transferase EntD